MVGGRRGIGHVDEVRIIVTYHSFQSLALRVPPFQVSSVSKCLPTEINLTSSRARYETRR